MIIGTNTFHPLHSFPTSPIDSDTFDGRDAWTRTFLSSVLFVSEHHELLPQDSFLWNLIYPKGRDGNPSYSSSSKYAVKLYHCGAWRRVFIDDRFPLDTQGNSIYLFIHHQWSSHSKNTVQTPKQYLQSSAQLGQITVRASTPGVKEVRPNSKEVRIVHERSMFQ